MCHLCCNLLCGCSYHACTLQEDRQWTRCTCPHHQDRCASQNCLHNCVKERSLNRHCSISIKEDYSNAIAVGNVHIGDGNICTLLQVQCGSEFHGWISGCEVSASTVMQCTTVDKCQVWNCNIPDKTESYSTAAFVSHVIIILSLLSPTMAISVRFSKVNVFLSGSWEPLTRISIVIHIL